MPIHLNRRGVATVLAALRDCQQDLSENDEGGGVVAAVDRRDCLAVAGEAKDALL